MHRDLLWPGTQYMEIKAGLTPLKSLESQTSDA